MRQSKILIPTLREVPADAEVVSHQLMLRAGLVRQLASGIYSYLPLGYRVLKKVEEIVRQEMDRSGAQEILASALQPAELWEESGRLSAYGPELMRLKDRHNRDFLLGPTHEEVFTVIMRDDVDSYKKLPMTLYQVQNKFRDERRPRFGVIRARDFIMKDAYSFDRDEAGLDVSYQAMYDAYQRIFNRCQLNYRIVEADGGAIGDAGGTHEFMVLSEIGEDTIAYCNSCGYSANIEKAQTVLSDKKNLGEELALEEVSTPDTKTIKAVSDLLKVDEAQLIKTMLYQVDDKVLAVLTLGVDEVNEIKLKNHFNAEEVFLVEDEKFYQDHQLYPGYIGPVGLSDKIEIIADLEVQNIKNAISGANKENYHLKNINYPRDFQVTSFADLKNIKEGDPCPNCRQVISFDKGIEVGHVFKLGKKYSQALGAKYLDENGRAQDMVMGCYGIGVSRTVAAIVEQHSQDAEIVWPLSVSPYQVHILIVNGKNEDQVAKAEEIYQDLLAAGIEVLLDDRPERIGVKFKDADLIGIPLRVVVGGKVGEGLVEVKVRHKDISMDLEIKKLLEFLQTEIRG